MEDEYRIAYVVRKDLKMGMGKVIGQTNHALMGLYQHSKNKDLDFWSTCAKIVLKIDNEEELYKLRTEAAKAGIISYLVHDAGRTQIESGSATVLAIGPAKKKDLDKVVGNLKLY